MCGVAEREAKVRFMNKNVIVLTTCLLLSVRSTHAAEQQSDESLRKTAQRIHARSILVDGHNDITLFMTGAGGMGEVFRARDTRLNRDVAERIAGSGGRLHTFARRNYGR
jgi:hypothetical protein